MVTFLQALFVPNNGHRKGLFAFLERDFPIFPLVLGIHKKKEKINGCSIFEFKIKPDLFYFFARIEPHRLYSRGYQ